MSEQLEQEPINDPPIEHDSLGQALLTLPLALAEGGVEVVAWVASETIIPVAEALIEPFEEPVQYPVPNPNVPASEEITGSSSSVAHDEAP